MNYDAFAQSIVTLHREALGRAALAVNRALILRNWMIGAYIVEFEQKALLRVADWRASRGEDEMARKSGAVRS